MSLNIDNTIESIDLGEGVRLIYKEAEIFSRYLAIYHAEKHAGSFFTSSSAKLSEKAGYLKCGHFIYKDETFIGGVFIKPNFIADLFLVPPFADYAYVLNKIIPYLKSISDSNEKILLQEVVEEYVPFYEAEGFTIYESGYWMIRPTETLNFNLPAEYQALEVTEEYKEEIAELILETYMATPAIKSIYDKAEYISHVERFIEAYKDNEAIYTSSRIVQHIPTKKIVGSCLSMVFENLPLIMSFAVAPEHQGKGVGSYLIRNSISSCYPKYPATRLYVYKDNPALKVYEHMNFIKNTTLNDMHLVLD